MKTVTHNGISYQLTSEASLSNRIFPGCWSSAQEEDDYTAEWCAEAVDANGTHYLVYWQWDETRGNELEDAGDYDWGEDNIDRVELL
jgi:hypothetical protein